MSRDKSELQEKKDGRMSCQGQVVFIHFPAVSYFPLHYRKLSINSAVTKLLLLFDPFHFLILLMILYRRNLILLHSCYHKLTLMDPKTNFGVPRLFVRSSRCRSIKSCEKGIETIQKLEQQDLFLLLRGGPKPQAP